MSSSVSKYQNWSEKAAENAIALATEAHLLLQNNHLSRAYYLAHMSTEESSKSILLRAISTFDDSKYDDLKLSKFLSHHKNKINFIVLFASTLSTDFQNELGELQEELTKHINDLKNDSMYVSYESGVIVTPLEKVANVDVGRFVESAMALSTIADRFLTEPVNESDSGHLLNSIDCLPY